jgi:hypothetical protein
MEIIKESSLVMVKQLREFFRGYVLNRHTSFPF